jgi:hypothetical protein
MTNRIDSDRLARFLRPEIRLRKDRGQGEGANGEIDMCLMQAVDWLAGGSGRSDAPECVDPVIRRFCMDLNDSQYFSKWRNKLKPFAPKIVDTYVDDALTRARGFMCADWAVRRLPPLAFDFFMKLFPRITLTQRERLLEWAQVLRDIPPILDRETARAGGCMAAAVHTEATAAANVDADTYITWAAYLACADCVRQAEYAAHAAYGISAVEAAATIAAETWVIFNITTIQAVVLSTALRHRQKKTKAFSCALWRESRDFLQRLIDAQTTPCA